jgi:hypothetical protein
VRACVQCGLSVGESATFCAVCGAQFDADGAVAALEADQVVEGSTAEAEAEAAASGGTDRWADAEPYEPSAELVADLGDEPHASDGSALDADTTSEAGRAADAARSKLEPGPVEVPALEADPEPQPEAQTVLAETAIEPVEAEPSPPETSVRERKLAAAGVLLDAAAGFEGADTARAAALYQEAIVGCLDAADDPAGFEGVDHELLRGFDGLSSLLARGGLVEDALGVVEDAASLGLLNGGGDADAGRRDALLERRQDLRRLLFADSAQL